MEPEKQLQELMAKVEDLVKATSTNATYAFTPDSRSLFAPENLDPETKEVYLNKIQFRPLIPREAGFGQAAAWTRMKNLNSIGNVGGFADAGTPATPVWSVDEASAAYKNVGFDADLGRQMIASSRKPGEAVDRLMDKAEQWTAISVMTEEERMLIHGDSSVRTTEFDGFLKLITTNSGSEVFLTMSGINKKTAQVKDTYGGDIDILVTNTRQVNALHDEFESKGSTNIVVSNGEGNVTAGVKLSAIMNETTGQPIKVISKPSSQMGGNALLLSSKLPEYAPATVAMQSAGAAFMMSDLEALGSYEVPATTHSRRRRVYESTTLKLFYEAIHYKIQGLETSFS